MNPRQSMLILVVISVVYGSTVGLLGALESGATFVVALVGAFVLAALWTVRSLLMQRQRTHDS